MDWFTHYMYAFILGRRARLERYEMIALLTGALLPDTDFVFGLLGVECFREYHRTFTHSIFVAPLLGLILALILYLVFRRKLLIPATLGVYTHLLLDAFSLPRSSLEYLFPGASYNRKPYDMGTAYFWPISSHRFTLNSAMGLEDWTSFLIFFVIFSVSAGSFVNYLRKGINPLYPFIGTGWKERFIRKKSKNKYDHHRTREDPK